MEITEIEDDSSYYEYYKDEKLIPLEVHVIYKSHHYKYDGNDNSYDLPFTFTFSLMKEDHTIEVDDYKKFYEACVKLIADVYESHKSKSYLDDSYD